LEKEILAPRLQQNTVLQVLSKKPSCCCERFSCWWIDNEPSHPDIHCGMTLDSKRTQSSRWKILF